MKSTKSKKSKKDKKNSVRIAKCGYYGYAFDLPKDDDRLKRFSKQRKTRGFDESELWSLDCTISKFILPRLIAFREASFGVVPSSKKRGEIVYNAKIWLKDLDAIISGFTILVEKDSPQTEEEQKTVKTALSLFAKRFDQLWF